MELETPEELLSLGIYAEHGLRRKREREQEGGWLVGLYPILTVSKPA